MALATSASIGSVATLVGNPQNRIIGSLSGIPFPRFSAALMPVAVVSLALAYAVLRIGFHRVLKAATIQRPEGPPPRVDRWLVGLTAAVFAAVLAGFMAGANLPWTAQGGVALIMVLARRDTHEVLKFVDWHLLLFFAALSIVVEGLNGTELPRRTYDALRGVFGTAATAQAWSLSWFSMAGSNIFSNVPFVLVAGKWIGNFTAPDLMWKVLALSTTFAGNLTILGSVANIIVVESARGHVEVGFRDYA